MIIAISQKQEKNVYGEAIDTLEHNYTNYFQELGIETIPISNAARDIERHLINANAVGIIISGGNDVDPASYGECREEGMPLVPERDRIEKLLLDFAIREKIPVLCICRGMQFLNVYLSGKLVNIRKELGAEKHLPGEEHALMITDPEAQEILGKQSKVNSFHNYGITMKTMSPQLKAFAVSPDGLIEGVYRPSLPIAGIQWHPERKSPDEGINRKLVEAFVGGKLFWVKE